MNEKNLIPNTKRTPEERRENATKAGIASGKSRRQKKKLKQALEAIMSEKVPQSMDKVQNMLHEFGINEEESTFQIALAVMLVKKALDGNIRSAELIATIMGQTADHDLKEREFTHKKKMDRQKIDIVDKTLADPSALIAVLKGTNEQESVMH